MQLQNRVLYIRTTRALPAGAHAVKTAMCPPRKHQANESLTACTALSDRSLRYREKISFGERRLSTSRRGLRYRYLKPHHASPVDRTRNRSRNRRAQVGNWTPGVRVSGAGNVRDCGEEVASAPAYVISRIR